MKKGQKAVLEKQIENAILTYLNYLPSCFAWKNNSTGVYDPRAGVFRSNKNRFAINGVSDILGICNGKLLAFEVKRDGGRASRDQLKFIDRIRSLGGVAAVVYSVQEVRELMEEHCGIKTFSEAGGISSDERPDDTQDTSGGSTNRFGQDSNIRSDSQGIPAPSSNKEGDDCKSSRTTGKTNSGKTGKGVGLTKYRNTTSLRLPKRPRQNNNNNDAIIERGHEVDQVGE